jgi:hypothetical protein
LVKLYLGYAQLVGARVNGRPIVEDVVLANSQLQPCAEIPLSIGAGKTCQLMVSPSYGLRYGVNVLTVQFRLGHSIRVRTVRFVVGGDRPLAAAGRDRRVRPGTRVRLNGRGSLIPAGLRQRLIRAGKRPSLRYRWRVVRVPRGARRVKLAGANTAGPTTGGLPAVGIYEFRLTVIAPNGQTGSGLIAVSTDLDRGGAGGSTTTAPDAAPLASVETMVKLGDRWGVLLRAPGFIDRPPQGCTDRTAGSNSCFYADPGNGRKWLQLLVLDRGDLSLQFNEPIDCPQATVISHEHDFDFVSGGDVYYNNKNPCIAALVNFLLTKVNDNELVIAVNQPGDNMHEQPPVGVGAALSGKFIQPFDNHNLGIGASGWFDAPGNGRDLPQVVRGTFSAVGVPGWTAGGVSKMPQDPGSWDPRGAGDLNTYIAVDNVARYAPFPAPSGQDEADSPLLKVLTQAAANWPAMSSGEAAAFSAIGKQTGLTSDPRTFYYTASSSEDWDNRRIDVLRSRYSDFGSSPPFSQDEFNAAYAELLLETGYLADVKAYLGALAEPYRVNQGTLWANVAKTASDIVSTETANTSGAKAFSFTTKLIEGVLDAIPVLGKAAKLTDSTLTIVKGLTVAYKAAVKAAETSGGKPAGGDISVTAADLGSELAHRLSAAQQEINDRFFNIVVADPDKLKAVALCSTGKPDCPDPRDAWSLKKNQVANLDQLLEVGLERELFTTLVPVKYSLALGLEPVSSLHRSDASNDAAKWCLPFPAFEHTTGVYMWQNVDDNWLVTHHGHPEKKGWAFTPIVLTTGDPGFAKTWHAASWTVFHRMFDAVDTGGNLAKGGFGIDEQQFMSENYGLNGNSYRPSDLFQPFLTTSLSSCNIPGWPWD